MRAWVWLQLVHNNIVSPALGQKETHTHLAYKHMQVSPGILTPWVAIAVS